MARIARGDVRLYQFAPPGKSRPVVVLTRDSALAYLPTATVAPITFRIRGVPSGGHLDRRRRNESRLRRESASCSYGFAVTVG